MIRFELPSLGADMDEGTLLEWRVKPGDQVKRGQVIAVVDTSKAAVDVEIWHDGEVAELLVQPGQKIPVGTVMATFIEPGERAPAPAAAPAAPATPAAPVTAAPPSPAAPVTAAAPASPITPPEPSWAGAVPVHAPGARELAAAARHPVSPAARRRARELDVDPETVSGTGPGGAVTIADVERAAAARAAPMPAATPVPSVAPTAPAAPLSPADRALEMRKAIAAAMSRSKREIPHYYLSEAIPMDRALDWLAARNAQRPITERVLPAVVQLKAVALALARTPELNGFWRDGALRRSDAVHVGVAISLRGGGLVAPAIHDVHQKPLDELMRDLNDLVRRARAGSLRSSEMSDPTITVTNLGDQGVESVFGVIYPPQVALVGFGRIAQRAWVRDGWIGALPVVTASLAADHRASDGHRGALFLAELRERLLAPESLEGSS